MKPKQEKCIELMISGTMTQKEIASAINISEKTICNWKKHNEEFIEAYNNGIKDKICIAAAQALNTQIKLLKSESDSVRHQAAKDLLDRAGFKPDDKVEISGHLDTETSKLDAIIEQMRGGGNDG